MIAYFDTSAFVPLLVQEPTTSAARALWDEADAVASVRLLYPEARAALAQAQRGGRMTRPGLRLAVRQLDVLFGDLDIVEVDSGLAVTAGGLAEKHALRGYDAVHLAAAARLRDDDVVVVAGDLALLGAAATEGLHTAALA